ncbi:MAG: hypothetical protein MI922_04745 [Bacteroidales bacterium]|nr:hypothetical protein [Bacteroidales bacterium]
MKRIILPLLLLPFVLQAQTKSEINYIGKITNELIVYQLINNWEHDVPVALISPDFFYLGHTNALNTTAMFYNEEVIERSGYRLKWILQKELTSILKSTFIVPAEDQKALTVNLFDKGKPVYDLVFRKDKQRWYVNYRSTDGKSDRTWEVENGLPIECSINTKSYNISGSKKYSEGRIRRSEGKDKRGISTIIEYEYPQNNDVILNLYEQESRSGIPDLKSIKVLKKNGEGLVTDEESRNSRDKMEMKTVFIYDEKGNLSQELTNDKIQELKRINYFYDDSSNLKRKDLFCYGHRYWLSVNYENNLPTYAEFVSITDDTVYMIDLEYNTDSKISAFSISKGTAKKIGVSTDYYKLSYNADGNLEILDKVKKNGKTIKHLKFDYRK